MAIEEPLRWAARLAVMDGEAVPEVVQRDGAVWEEVAYANQPPARLAPEAEPV